MKRKRKAQPVAFPRSKREIALGILSSVAQVKRVVEGIASGEIEVEASESSHNRFAPHYARGLGQSDPKCKPYSVCAVARLLTATTKGTDGNLYANRWVRLAFDLLEALEMGWIEADVLEKIAEMKPGHKVQSLTKAIRAARKAHTALEAA